jgi:hypothetical protein
MKKILILIASIALLNTGCQKMDFGDTNKNVNGPEIANTSSMLSGAMTRFATRTGRPYWVTPNLFVQYVMQLEYTDEMLYADVAGFWDVYYSQCLSNLQTVINICEDPANAGDAILLGNGALENQIGISRIFKALVFKRVTDLFGDIPYSEALNPEILQPKYDAQQDIYTDLIAEVKAGRDMLDPTGLTVKGDIIYGGSVSKWQKFANSLLLSMTMQLSKKYPAAGGFAATEFNAALNHSAGVIQSTADEAWYTYDYENGFTNPWNWIRPADYSMSKEFCDALRGLNANVSNTTYDSRLLLFANDGTPGGATGHDYGYSTDPPGQYNAVNGIILDPGASMPIITAAYTYLNRAEAAALGWTTEDEATLLQTGIQLSYATLASHFDPTNDYNIGDGVAYSAARNTDAGTVGYPQVIREEKWVALFPCGFDAWAEWRRTETPTLIPAIDALNNGDIPRRYNYPTTEQALNKTGYDGGVSTLTPGTDNNSSKFWWDQD